MLAKFDKWLQQILWEHKLNTSSENEATREESVFDVHRVKGILKIESGEAKMVQGVRDVFEITDVHSFRGGDQADSGGAVEGKLVMIGKGLANLPWSKDLMAYLTL